MRSSSVIELTEPLDLDTLPAALDRASGHATTSVPIAAPHETARAVRERLIGRAFDTVADIPVCDGLCLVGMVPIEARLAADHELAVSTLMDPEPARISPHADQEIAAWTMLCHRGDALAVVDDNGALLGVIPPERMLRVLLQEHEEDIARFSGLLANSSRARMASEERVGLRLMHRLPWLAIGLIGAMLSAWLVGSAEEQLARTVQLAFFLPAIVYMADAVGTQTETLAVRGLSVGVPIRRFVGKELASGVLIGALIAALFSRSVSGRSTIRRWPLRCRSRCSPAASSPLPSPSCCHGRLGSCTAIPLSVQGRWRQSSRTCSRSPSTWR
jgi:magnesium transporter